MDIEPGTVVAGRYRVQRPLGRGGMGEVFAAENVRTGRPVAVKLLRAESKQKSSAVARFRREARAAGSINSDFVTEILDVEEDDEYGIALVFELLEGESLIDRLKRTGPIGYNELHTIIVQVWRGLADAHRAGIIHRDLKPSNVFLEQRPDGQIRVKILDFGISKLPKEMGGETLTEMGQSLGTFSFMPPEQIGKAKTVDHRADIYACATLIYQALSGQLPYAAKNVLLMVEMKSKQEPRKLAEVMSEPVDPRLEDFLARSLARDPNQRFQTADEALAAWQQLAPGSATRAAPSQQSAPAQAAPSQAAGQNRSPTLDPRSPNILPHVPSKLPVVHDHTTSSDSAATIAMPISQIGQVRPSQPGLLQHTLPVLKPTEPEDSASTEKMAPAAAPQSGHYTPGSQRYDRTIAIQQQSRQSYHRVTESSPSLPALRQSRPDARDIGVESQGGQDQTRVYRPDPRKQSQSGLNQSHSGINNLPPDVRQSGNITHADSEDEESGGILPFVLGAIIFALVGFAVVAALLHYTRGGAMPWQ